MPIYEYRCTACGFQREYLQKMGAAQLTVCPECGKASFSKMVTSAGFKLKGSGWYATDFKHGAKPKDQTAAKSEDKAAAKPEDKADTKTESQPAAKANDKPALETPAKKSDASTSTATSGANPVS